MRTSKTKKLSMEKADKNFSLYIRKRDANEQGLVKCCTCGVIAHWKEMDCGHFISRRKQSTRYDKRNAHAQCKKCNRFEHGNQYKHSLYIDDRYGKGTAESIEIKSNMHCKRNQYDFEEIAKEFKEMI